MLNKFPFNNGSKSESKMIFKMVWKMIQNEKTSYSFSEENSESHQVDSHPDDPNNEDGDSFDDELEVFCKLLEPVASHFRRIRV